MFIANKGESYKKGLTRDNLLSKFNWKIIIKQHDSGLTEAFLDFQGKKDSKSYMRDTYKSEFEFRFRILERVEELLKEDGWNFYQIIH
jgi:hypothetical protein